MTPLVFVVPDPEATISGGNLYNLGLTAALRSAGVHVRVVDLAGAIQASPALAFASQPQEGRKPEPLQYFVDSLYLQAVPRLRRFIPASASLELLVHYLPTLVALGTVPEASALSTAEREALAAADGFVAPSEYMARALIALGCAPARVRVVAPGLSLPPPADDAAATSDVTRGILLGNLVPGKGVLPFLDALLPHLAAGAPFQLTVVGDFTMDPAYAAACQARVADQPAVTLTGLLSHASAMSRLRESDVLVSPSRMESFGLALAEARALGVPILALDAGNAAAHVAPEAGGCLVGSDEALAAECARLAADPLERVRRLAAARARRPPARTWADAAAAFLAQPL